jgi:transposase
MTLEQKQVESVMQMFKVSRAVAEAWVRRMKS